MKRLIVPLLLCAAPAFAIDPASLIAQCNAPVAKAIDVAAISDAQSAEWNNLNLIIQAHRHNCATPMAVACHLSDSPRDCYAETLTAVDALAEVERRKLDAYAEANGVLFGDLPRQRARTTEARAAERDAYCGQQSNDSSVSVAVLGGDTRAACELEIAISQWAVLSFSGAAPEALSLLPPQ